MENFSQAMALSNATRPMANVSTEITTSNVTGTIPCGLENFTGIQSFNGSSNTTLGAQLSYFDTLIAYVFLGINFIAALASISSNSLIIASFIKYEFVQTVDNYFLLSLSVADFIAAPALLLATVLSVFYIDSVSTGPLCVFAGGLMAMGLLCQIWSIQLVTIDRWMCVNYPLRAPRPLTENVAKILIVLVWAVIGTFVVSAMVYNSWEPGKRCFSFRVLNIAGMRCVALPMGLIPLLVMPVLYFMMCRTALRHARQIRVQNFALADPTLTERSQQLKTMKTLKIILGLLYLSWLPLLFTFGFGFVPVDKASWSWKALVVMYNLANTALFAGSFLNPLVYHWSCPNFSKAMRLLLFPQRAREHYRQKAIRDLIVKPASRGVDAVT